MPNAQCPTRQLEAEEREAAAAGAPLEGHESCLQMVQVTLALALALAL